MHPQTGMFIDIDTVFEIDKEFFAPDVTNTVNGREVKVYDSWMEEVPDDTPLGIPDQTEDEEFVGMPGFPKKSQPTIQAAFEAHEKFKKTRPRIPAKVVEPINGEPEVAKGPKPPKVKVK